MSYLLLVTDVELQFILEATAQAEAGPLVALRQRAELGRAVIKDQNYLNKNRTPGKSVRGVHIRRGHGRR
jgi:hypothetical protein